jgi:hypothetical protein
MNQVYVGNAGGDLASPSVGGVNSRDTIFSAFEARGRPADVPSDLSGAQVLGLDDFGREAAHRVGAERLVPVAGVVSNGIYLVPESCVFPGAVDTTANGMAAAETAKGAVDQAVADLLATDLLVRWWDAPGEVVLDVTGMLPAIGALGRCPAGDGLEVSAFMFERIGFLLAVVVHVGGGAAATMGHSAAAGAAGAANAISGALLSAVRARSAMLSDLSARQRARHLQVWHCGPEYLAELLRRSLPAGRLPGDLAAPDWPAVATRWFGHEPLVATARMADRRIAARVICPGAVPPPAHALAPNPFVGR